MNTLFAVKNVKFKKWLMLPRSPLMVQKTNQLTSTRGVSALAEQKLALNPVLKPTVVPDYIKYFTRLQPLAVAENCSVLCLLEAKGRCHAV